MNLTEMVIGQTHKWSLLRKLGEGDAGDVYLVESLLEGRTGILKRPRRGVFSGDSMRQAAQIKTEGKILNALNGISLQNQDSRISIPALIDQSLQENGVGERYFIVIERAPGFDLKSLSLLIHSGVIGEIDLPPEEENELFARTLTGLKKFPEPILIRVLLSILNLLDSIHSTELMNEGVRQHGVIWNDVKPEHMFWDPIHTRLTVIDWGNSYFLEKDKITKDRKHTYLNDYIQFIQGMGQFLVETNPDLFENLDWPQTISPGDDLTGTIRYLEDKLRSLHREILGQAQTIRNDIQELYGTSRPGINQLSKTDSLHRKIVSYGEIPDYSSAENFYARVALKLASENKLDEFQKVCERTAALRPSAIRKWGLLTKMAGIAFIDGEALGSKFQESLSRALMAGVTADWPTFLWEILSYYGGKPLPDWWDSVSLDARRIYLNLDNEVLTPYITISQMFYTFQAAVLQMGDNQTGSSPEGELEANENLLKLLNDEVLRKWREIEPAPPHSGIGYSGIDGLLEGVERVIPDTREKIESVLSQPKAQAEIVLKAWDGKEFDRARGALRMVLIWDPDLRRVLQADQAIGTAAEWLSNIRRGSGSEEPFYDFLSTAELNGRKLLNRVGRAKWLDEILDALKQLRKGTRPADLILEYPEISLELPWLNEYRSREILSLPHSRALGLEREDNSPDQVRAVRGIVEGRLAPDRDLHLAEPLDMWVPEARGSSARVFAGFLKGNNKERDSLAIKIIRPDKLDYALPLFREEAQILSMMRDVPGITPLVECGYLSIEDGMDFPNEDRNGSAAHLRGNLIRYGSEEVQNFLAGMERQLASGWLPYLALVKRSQDNNLMKYCDAGMTHGWFLPIREGLLLSIQICDILQYAHDRYIVYRDHKILHYYWDPDAHGVVMIDWNIAKRQPQGLSDAEKQFDIAQFGARALHHILTGRPAAGALPLGPNRPEEIEQASMKYPVNWTYDDERLPVQVKDILERVLNQGYSQIRELRNDLVQIYEQIPDAVQVADTPLS